MYFSLASILLAAFGLVASIFGLRILLREVWFRGWLVGTVGLTLVLFSCALIATALHLYRYSAGEVDQAIATISFREIKKQKFEATLVITETGIPHKYYLNGDQWQVNARILRWNSLLRSLGAKSGYRLDKISGRYLTLDEDHTQDRTSYRLMNQEFGLDLWAWVRKHKETPGVEAIYGKAAFVPMADGALFEVTLSDAGLQAKPLNSAAIMALAISR